jgi:hypothetical protein
VSHCGVEYSRTDDIIPLWVQFYEVPDVSKHPNKKVNQGNTRENYTVIIIQ